MTKKRSSKRRPETMTPADVDNLTPAEVLILARAIALKRHGTALPAGLKTKVDWTKEKRTCPHCEKKGTVIPTFGVVMKRGVETAQSWCSECRAGGGYESKPRVYDVKHTSSKR